MAYEDQIKCAGCGMSIPAVAEDADPAALLCDRCYAVGTPTEPLTVYTLDAHRTPEPFRVSEFDETGGYDCMFSGLRVGPFRLAGDEYGQKSCHPMRADGYARMRADALFAAHAINNFMIALKALKEEHEAWAILAEELGHAHQPCVCPTCKLIASMEQIPT